MDIRTEMMPLEEAKEASKTLALAFQISPNVIAIFQDTISDKALRSFAGIPGKWHRIQIAERVFADR